MPPPAGATTLTPGYVLGRRQAAAMADALAPLGPLPVIASGLLRCRETAEVLCERWRTGPLVDSRVEEIPTPAGMGLADRVEWLRGVMSGRWSTDAPALGEWCDEVVECLLALQGDTVVVTHFVAINVAVGRATDDDRVVCFLPDNCSRTVLDNAGGRLRVVELGMQAATEVR